MFYVDFVSFLWYYVVGEVIVVSEIIHYIDVSDALKRIGGSMDLYKRLLKQYSGTDHIEPLEESLRDGVSEDASRKLHTLKGVCANLSLSKLAAAAADLEKIVHDGTDYSESFEKLKDIYHETSQQISEII